MRHGEHGRPPPLITRVKTLPSRNFVGGIVKKAVESKNFGMRASLWLNPSVRCSLVTSKEILFSFTDRALEPDNEGDIQLHDNKFPP